MDAYTVRFEKRVQTGAYASSRDVVLYRIVAIPFPPFVGLEVVDGDWIATVESVAFRTRTSEIICYTQTDSPGKYDQVPRPMDDIVRAHVAYGWNIAPMG